VLIGDKEAARRVLEYKPPVLRTGDGVDIQRVLKLAKTLGTHVE